MGKGWKRERPQDVMVALRRDALAATTASKSAAKIKGLHKEGCVGMSRTGSAAGGVWGNGKQRAAKACFAKEVRLPAQNCQRRLGHLKAVETRTALCGHLYFRWADRFVSGW